MVTIRSRARQDQPEREKPPQYPNIKELKVYEDFATSIAILLPRFLLTFPSLEKLELPARYRTRFPLAFYRA
jgi:hypothetical protein